MSKVRIKTPVETQPEQNASAFAAELVSIDSLHPHPRNYRQHPDDQIEHLIASIKEHGFYRNVVVAQDSTILAGHGTVQAARQMGMQQIPVVRLPLDANDPRALKVLTGDNSIEHLAEDDDRLLSEILKEIHDTDGEELLGTGYDEKMLANLIFVTRPRSEIADLDEASQWVGMPEYGDNVTPVWSLTINFKSPEVMKQFADEHGYILNEKTRSVWWPQEDKIDYKSVRFE